MPADKLILLCPYVKKSFRTLSEQGHPKGRYAHFIDLQKTKLSLPVRLYTDGFHGGLNKIEFIQVATLGLTRVEEIVKLICEYLRMVRIFRIDWAVDLLGVSAWDLAACCRVVGVQSSAFYHSRGGVSFYPHRSRARAILIYERQKRLKLMRHPLAEVFSKDENLTRIEVQFRGSGVPIQSFGDIRGYANIDLLDGVVFLKLRRLRADLKPQQILAAEGMRMLVHELGLQNASKRFSASSWAYMSKRFFEPAPEGKLPNVHSLMQKSARDWLEDRIRFPRL